jgi:hypothetical protein
LNNSENIVNIQGNLLDGLRADHDFAVPLVEIASEAAGDLLSALLQFVQYGLDGRLYILVSGLGGPR